MGNKKKSFDSYSKKPLKDEVRKAMKRYFKQLDQKNMPIDVYQLVLNEVEPPLLDAVMKFANNNQSKSARILGMNRTTLRTKLKKYNINIPLVARPRTFHACNALNLQEPLLSVFLTVKSIPFCVSIVGHLQQR